MPFTIGESVGQYKIVQQLGQGGMATVYRAYHENLDRSVAIKVLHAALKSDPNFATRFRREAQIIAKLEHPYIVPVYDYSEHHGEPYLVMKFIEGETLKDRMLRDPLTIGETLQLITAIGGALTYAHEHDVLHRDIKPSNILIDKQGVPFLADFGLARMASAGESTLSRDMMLGTPQYISPEQAQGNVALTGATDIYSLAVVVYELVVGDVPFTADTPYAIIHDHIYKPLPLPSGANKNVPAAIESVLLKALAKAPEDRYPTASALADALRSAVGEANLTPSRVIALPPPKSESSGPTPRRATSSSAAVKTPFPLPSSVAKSEATVSLTAQTSRRRLPLLILALAIAAVGLIGVVILSAQNQPANPASTGTLGTLAAALNGTPTPALTPTKTKSPSRTATPSPSPVSTVPQPVAPSMTPPTRVSTRPSLSATPWILATVDPAIYNLSLLDAVNLRKTTQSEAQNYVDSNPRDPIGYFLLAYELSMTTKLSDLAQNLENAQTAFLVGLQMVHSDPDLMMLIAQKLLQAPNFDRNAVMPGAIATLYMYAYAVGAATNNTIRNVASQYIFDFANNARAGGPIRRGNNYKEVILRSALLLNNSYLYALVALAAQKSEAISEIQPNLAKALALDANLPETRLILGIILKVQNKSDEARKVLIFVQNAKDAPTWATDEARKQLEGL